MHNFCVKMFGYSPYIYYLQQESKHFLLRVLTNFDLEVLKSTKLTNIFELYQVFICPKMF